MTLLEVPLSKHWVAMTLDHIHFDISKVLGGGLFSFSVERLIIV